MNVNSLLPSVTDEQPFQDHLWGKTIVQTWRVCLSGYLINEHGESSPLSPAHAHFKTIFQVKLFYWLSLWHKFWTKLPHWSLIWPKWQWYLAMNMQSLPQCHSQMVIWRWYWKQNYHINLWSFVSLEMWIMNVQSLPQCHLWMATARQSS